MNYDRDCLLERQAGKQADAKEKKKGVIIITIVRFRARLAFCGCKTDEDYHVWIGEEAHPAFFFRWRWREEDGLEGNSLRIKLEMEASFLVY